jgi:hypothetical protein
VHDVQAQQRNEAHQLAERETPLRPYRRASIIGAFWWWRCELGIAGSLIVGMYVLTSVVGTGQAVMGLALAAGLVGPWPTTHRAVTASAWRIITPHRLRVGFVQAGIQDWNGRLPTILHTTQQPFGERVLVWCQAGASAADFWSARDILTAACWASAIRVTRDKGHTNLVTIDVIRRQWPDSTAVDSDTGHLNNPARCRPDIQRG